jgi:shikimate kinase/3-dehydroquinate synthase
MMGTGKSTVGRAIAAQAGCPFIDLDELVERRAGATIAEIFRRDGEEAFRGLERSALQEQLRDSTPRVVALGGGALLERTLRLAALGFGTVVTLRADLEVILGRVRGHAARPLLGAAVSREKLQSLLDSRAAAYAEAHAVIDTSRNSASECAAEALRVAAAQPVVVPLGERTYTVDVVPGGGPSALAACLSTLSASRLVVVSDDVVAPLVLPRLEAALAHSKPLVSVIVPTGERHKTLASVELILRAAVDAPIDRQAVFVGVGGGVVTDMTGLAAALALRGVRWVAVPTTILSMVDASVGGKTAVDLGSAKNAVGAFHQPARVIVDATLAQTERARGVRSGLAEVVKTALLGDAELYEELRKPGGAEALGIEQRADLLARAVRSSVRVKAGVVGRDEKEAGERAHLNLGHTIGHALEAEGGFEALTHGEAVSLGLVAALRVGAALGVTPRALESEVVDVLRRMGLPTAFDEQPWRSALKWVAYDKKRKAGALRMVLLREPGRVEVAAVDSADLPRLLSP